MADMLFDDDDRAWTHETVRHSLRSANEQLYPIVEIEVWFLVRSALNPMENTQRQTLQQAADDARMSRATFDWLSDQIGEDFEAQNGLRRMYKFRNDVAKGIEAAKTQLPTIPKYILTSTSEGYRVKQLPGG